MSDEWILGIHHGHDSSICLLKNGEIILFVEEERHSRIKHDVGGESILNLVCNYTNKVDTIVHWDNETNYILPKFQKYTWSNDSVVVSIGEHHKLHAAVAFYNSGFETAACVVVDGSGIKANTKIRISKGTPERESIYFAQYPAKFKLLWDGDHKPKICDHSVLGNLYKQATVKAGFARREPGKFMGLSSYSTERIPFTSIESLIESMPTYTEDFDRCAAYANTIQEDFQEQMLKIIKHAIEITGSKNVVLSGGTILNVRANMFYKKNLTSDINIYCEPLCYDGGLSMGLAKFWHHYSTGDKTIRKQESLFYGNKHASNI